MLAENKIPRIAYFDTNIISHLAKNRNLWQAMLDYMDKNNIMMGISGAQLVELSDATKIHDEICCLIYNLPSVLLKEIDIVINEEVYAYPHNRKDSLISYLQTDLLMIERHKKKLLEFLSSRRLQDSRKIQLNDASQMKRRHNYLRLNYKPSDSGNYTRSQTDDFAWKIVVQCLSRTHNAFLGEFANDVESFNFKVFKSLRTIAYVIYYKYYLGKRTPIKISDFGDLFHLAYIPYCELVIMEKDLCNILNQIKKHQNIFRSTSINDIKYFEKLL